MRMHPGVQYPLERVVPSGRARICGFDIPAGTVVGVNADRNTDVFGADADDFRPERWLDKDGERIKIMDRHLLIVSLPSFRSMSVDYSSFVRTCSKDSPEINIPMLVSIKLIWNSTVWSRG
jgi:hypothetical protein